MKINQFYIAGKFITPDGKEVIELINPATEQKVGHVVSGSKKDVNEAVTAAQHAFQDASALSIEEKKTILQEIIEGMDERRVEFAQIISEEMGAPIKVAKGAQFSSGKVHFVNTLKVIDDFSFSEVHDNITLN